MDEFTAETFSELEKSAPVVAVSDANNDAEDDEGAGGGKSKSEEPVSKLRSAGSKIKTKFHDVIAGKNVATKNSLHDRIFIKYATKPYQKERKKSEQRKQRKPPFVPLSLPPPPIKKKGHVDEEDTYVILLC